MYNDILNIFVDFVGAAEGTLVFGTLEVLSTICCLFVCLIPFIVVYKVIQLLLG